MEGSSESPWSTKGARFSVLVNVLGGLLFGYTIGFVPIMLQFNQYFGDCSRYTTDSACNAMTDAGCSWVGSVHDGSCQFPDWKTVNCAAELTQGDCKSKSACFWQYHEEKCSHRVGWDANQQGMLAGAQIIGAMISSPLAGPLTNRFGRRWSMGACGITALVATMFFSVGWAMHENYYMLVVGELGVGLVAGWISVICPMYCGEMAAKELEHTIGVMFQVALTFGIWLAALHGLLLDPREDTAEGGAHIQRRLQYVIIAQWIMSGLVTAVGYIMPESTVWEAERANQEPLDGKHLLSTGVVTATEEPESPGSPKQTLNICRKAYLLPILVGVALASAQQLTGINAIMIYGPQLVATVGMKPLVGNFYIMLWNFLSCCMSIPLVKRFFPRQLYIGTTFVAMVSSVLTGIAVCPGIFADDSVPQRVLGAIGILAFVAAYECGIGPCFYVLAQDTFPEEVRSAGCSYIIWIQFVFNVVINWGFPVAVTGFSGGPSGDQNIGMAVCFFIFGGTGFLTALFMALKMPKSNSEVRKIAERAELDQES